MASQIIERQLYNGMYQMIHNPDARGRAPRYKVTSTQGETKPKGVTTILGAVLAKDFVGWALDCAEEYLQAKLPVITQADLTEAKLESARRRDSGAGTGTEAHALVENYLKDRVNHEAKAATGTPEAINAFKAFVKWFEAVKPKVINVEEVIYSHDFKFAGTYDCMLEIDGRVYLCDYKTTNVSRKAPNGIYIENFVQLGAYALAHEEQRVYEEANGGTNLRKIDGLMVISGKKNGKLDIATNEDIGLRLDDCSQMFKRIVNLYNFLNYGTKALGGK